MPSLPCVHSPGISSLPHRSPTTPAKHVTRVTRSDPPCTRLSHYLRRHGQCPCAKTSRCSFLSKDECHSSHAVMRWCSPPLRLSPLASHMYGPRTRAPRGTILARMRLCRVSPMDSVFGLPCYVSRARSKKRHVQYLRETAACDVTARDIGQALWAIHVNFIYAAPPLCGPRERNERMPAPGTKSLVAGAGAGAYSMNSTAVCFGATSPPGPARPRLVRGFCPPCIPSGPLRRAVPAAMFRSGPIRLHMI